MTPLGHASIAFLTAISATKLFPELPNSIILATTTGGMVLDLDLFYRFYQKGTKIFDETIGKHRFFPSHTPLFAFIISLILMLINFYFGLFFFIGTITHLLIDTLFFPEGINFFYPLNRKMYAFLTIKTHPFWAPHQISGVKNWAHNYLTSPLFWIAEALPFLLSIVLLLRGSY